ncbi:phage protein Gp36 family protein [Sandaracinus amylolyticus]|uniref:Uncharacterized protein n=1 Tax=Sandaracinus amylolyticus TaxID=927083 RepID=A0A0F6SEZ9_9BACT|nr:phage protein Gp36 family protein [Sandaracinus amylolyticus]AKF06074.1 hypothetical protein DB32_003223 [Sandaracinus amylolyticus]
MPYLDTNGFKALTMMPSTSVDELEVIAPGWLSAKLAAKSRWIDSRLAKRYAVPFDESNPPEAIRDWLARIVTLSAYLRRGVDATDEQFVEIQKDAEKAEQEVLEAANAETGLFELPLRSATNEHGITRGGPRSYSEASPYVWRDQQARVGREEDRNRGGTSRG